MRPVKRSGSARTLGVRRRSRATLLLLLAGVLLGAAVVLALARSTGDQVSDPGALLDVATNSVAAVNTKTGKLGMTASLPGRPTDVAAGGGTAWVATVDSTAVTGVNGRTRSILPSVRPPGSADAVAVGEGSAWVADGRRGVLARIEPGYERAGPPISFPRARQRPEQSMRLRAPRAALAAGAGAVWVTNGSDRRTRVDPDTGRMTEIQAGRPLNGVAVGAGAAWAIQSEIGDGVGVDPSTMRVTDQIPIAGRPGRRGSVPARDCRRDHCGRCGSSTATPRTSPGSIREPGVSSRRSRSGSTECRRTSRRRAAPRGLRTGTVPCRASTSGRCGQVDLGRRVAGEGGGGGCPGLDHHDRFRSEASRRCRMMRAAWIGAVAVAAVWVAACAAATTAGTKTSRPHGPSRCQVARR